MYFDKLSDLGIKLTRHSGSEKVKCPQCSDGRKNKQDKPLSVNITTGDFNCHNCGWHGNVRGLMRRELHKNYEKPDQNLIRNIQLNEKIVAYFEGRGISRKTVEKFMIFGKEEFMPQSNEKESCICFPYFRDGNLINIKYRSAKKHFKMVKDAELNLFNLNSVGEKRYMIITEGEFDCMAVYESGYGVDMFTDMDSGELINEKFSKWCVVSVPNGASKGNQKLDYLDNCSDWLLGIHEFIVATDNDEAGKMLKEELVRRLGVERCRLITYPIEEVVPVGNTKRRCKDLNEVLQYLGKDIVVRCIENAEFIPVDGVFYVDDLFPVMLDNFSRGVTVAPTTRFACMDKFFRWKKGEINGITGYGNHGKTTFVLQLMLTKSIWDGWKWAIFSPENYPACDFFDDIIEMYVGKWLNEMNEKEYREAAEFINDHIFYVYPENEHDINSINEKFRYLVLKKGIDGVLIDPFNQLDHTQKAYQREDMYLSEKLKDIKRFALLNNVTYNIVLHPVKPIREADKSLPVVDMYDMAGGAMWANKLDNIISYYRPNYHVDKTSKEVQVYIQKIKRKRTGGELGSFDLNMIWGKKRYADPTSGDMPCDPYLKKTGSQQQMFTEPQKQWKPYVDDIEF
jgi:twinkle protein